MSEEGRDREHEHEHDDGHEHEQEPLKAGEGSGKILLLDAFAGIAGDMCVAALVDLGVPREVVIEAVGRIDLGGVRLRFSSARAGAIGATRFEVLAPTEARERTWSEIDRLLEESSLDRPVADLARRVFRRIAQAEARVHRVPVDAVHFHEVGAVDSIVDVVGASACFAHLGAEVVTTPLPLGRGTVTCRHGVLPLPAPATLECLSGAPTLDAGIDAELVTPTGAAIVATVSTAYQRWPAFCPERVGWGAGSEVLPDRPNALRVVLGAPLEQASSVGGHVLVECNVDDITGELAGHALGALLSAGARDAWAVPVTMKKGRPGLTLAALCERGAEMRIAEAMLRETSTIGVRYVALERIERPRRNLEVRTRYGLVPVKLSEGPYGPAQVKPEFDVCVELAAQAGVPVREVLAEALALARATK